MEMTERHQGAGVDSAYEWSVEQRDAVAVLLVSGEVDLAAEVSLTAAAEACLAEAPLQCDLSEVTFIDSSGARILLELRRRHENRFVVSAASEPVMRVFELSGVVDFLMGLERPS